MPLRCSNARRTGSENTRSVDTYTVTVFRSSARCSGAGLPPRQAMVALRAMTIAQRPLIALPRNDGEIVEVRDRISLRPDPGLPGARERYVFNLIEPLPVNRHCEQGASNGNTEV